MQANKRTEDPRASQAAASSDTSVRDLREGIKSYRYRKGDRRSYLIERGESSSQTMLIDAGCFLPEMDERRLQLDYLLLTHCHFDHIVYAHEIKQVTGCKIVSSERCAHHLEKMDEVVLKERFQHRLGSEYDLIKPLTVDKRVSEGDCLGPLEVIETPGHSDGGLSFYHQWAKTVFTGDTYFGSQRGRTDLPGSNSADLECSISKIKQLNYNLLCPGHGDVTRA